MTREAPDIHIWWIDLIDPVWDRYCHALGQDEAERFRRMLPGKACDERRRSRIALKMLLARELGTRAACVGLAYGPYGKPFLPGAPLQFNISHSAGRAVIAIQRATDGAGIGVDVERLAGRKIDVGSILEMICDPQEKASIEALPEPWRRTAFFRLWTHKEAYCKAIGTGLYTAMNSFVVQRQGERDVVVPGSNERPRYLMDIPCRSGWTACVCAASADARPIIHSASPNLAARDGLTITLQDATPETA